ncbi:MAG TPA: segregation/condensation protein A [Anaerolinea thermolimosa]|uniref:Segregation and condensation protein A n=1 Tax=Anaerolinea thermolimosa TaxID=229919 RepID=A0A3D1JI02_9CHLR|nr:condensin subunit ScpA [Anaerolinea thermolimosa]HCE18113.1 segregation/condensation protein A [Anaerolinea thermolimosa]
MRTKLNYKPFPQVSDASAIIRPVSFQVAGHQTEHYRISTPVYEGPLDLLLELIEHAELDITALALAQVTDQYLAYLQHISDRDPAEVSAFLVIASRLLQIKSAALLPRPPAEASSKDDEDPGEALARQLIIYRRFKELAEVLADREARGLRTYLRVAQPAFKFEARLDLTGITVQHLRDAARAILLGRPDLPSLNQVVSRPRITIREKIHGILETLRRFGQTTFRSLLEKKTDRVEWIVTFLAMLELVKRRIVVANQDQLFGEIQIEPTGETLSSEAEVETEFID